MKLAQEKNTYQVVQPTISWAQDLYAIYMEVKLAHRFDAPGCANLTNIEIDMNQNAVSLDALCISINSKVRYQLDLSLWLWIRTDDSSYYTYQAVGKYHFVLAKSIKPARWPQLQNEESPKPQNTRLHIEWHQKYQKQLLDFLGDPYTEFPGHDSIHEEYEDELERDRIFELPDKGPIPLKKKKKKKKGKKKP